MGATVSAASCVKLAKHPTPMLGSKLLHFLVPEFFPVWDGAVVRDRCLRKEPRYAALCGKYRNGQLDEVGATYAGYVHFMIEELGAAKNYDVVRQTMLSRACMTEVVATWLYADMASFVFEICLLGKSCDRGR